MTSEIENNIKIAAQQNSPHDKEAFYARFIGIGVTAYQYDITWFTIFKSQLLALAKLSAGGMLPLAEIRKHYDKAIIDYPAGYVNYSFEQWMKYMVDRLLVVRYPSEMVEITHSGKDFLKYVTHWGGSADAKAN